MNGRYKLVLLLLIAIVVCAIWFFWQPDFHPAEIRNILLISIDTCRADYLSCYGYKDKTTPNIDVLAKGSPDQHAVNLRNADIEGPQHAHQTGVYGALGADQVLDVDLGQKDVFIAGGL